MGCSLVFRSSASHGFVEALQADQHQAQAVPGRSSSGLSSMARRNAGSAKQFLRAIASTKHQPGHGLPFEPQVLQARHH
jgi:hypothetical protein